MVWSVELLFIMKEHTVTKPVTNNPLKVKTVFWAHVILVIVAWFGPFVFWWPLMIAGYLAVQLQFYIYNACWMNEPHDLDEADHITFYSHLFESWGFRPNRKKLKFFIRQILYIVLAIFTLYWQVWLGNESII